MTAWSPPLPGPPCYPRSLPGSPATPPAVSYLLSCFRSLCDCSLSLKDSSLKSLLEPYTCLQLPPHSRFRSQARPRAAPSSQSRPAPSCQPPPHSPSDPPYGQRGFWPRHPFLKPCRACHRRQEETHLPCLLTPQARPHSHTRTSCPDLSSHT